MSIDDEEIASYFTLSETTLVITSSEMTEVGQITMTVDILSDYW